MTRTKKSWVSPQELTLVLITIYWGATFSVVQVGLDSSGPFYFVALRVLIAALFSTFIFRKQLKGVTPLEWIAGIIIGVIIFIGYGFQTLGLKHISSSQSGFITALYVPMVPLLQWLILRKPPSLKHWVGIFLAFIGMMLIANPSGQDWRFGIGQWLTLISTTAIALEIILISYYANLLDFRRVTIVQLWVAACLALILALFSKESTPQFQHLGFLAAIIFLGIGSGLIQLCMNWTQRSLSPTKVTLIYSIEPIWAGLIGWWIGERITWITLAGCALIILGVLTSELNFRTKDKPEPEQKVRHQ